MRWRICAYNTVNNGFQYIILKIKTFLGIHQNNKRQTNEYNLLCDLLLLLFFEKVVICEKKVIFPLFILF